jgi:hypothetical protein
MFQIAFIAATVGNPPYGKVYDSNPFVWESWIAHSGKICQIVFKEKEQ